MSPATICFSLLNDILDISKLDAGKVEFEVGAVFPLRALFDNVTSIVEASAVQKGLEVRSVIDDARTDSSGRRSKPGFVRSSST